jgi:hypothetical protein
MGFYEMEPLQRRLNDLMENRTIRKLIPAEESSINFQEAVKEGRIVLDDIQKGEVGETVSNLVGSIVITKVWTAAQSRITQLPETRDPFHLYVDSLRFFHLNSSKSTPRNSVWSNATGKHRRPHSCDRSCSALACGEAEHSLASVAATTLLPMNRPLPVDSISG